jgi:hypothetical protein
VIRVSRGSGTGLLEAVLLLAVASRGDDLESR